VAVIRKLGWIRRQQSKFQNQPRQSAREMVNGESHFFRGKRYRLRIVAYEGAGRIRLRPSATMELHVRTRLDVEGRALVLRNWYRQQLKERIPPLLRKWEPVVGARANDWGVRRMKTKWGSCNTKAGRIWINLELAKKPDSCLEYIVVHELVHLLERRHNDNFFALMDRVLPRWRLLRAELNHSELSAETWNDIEAARPRAAENDARGLAAKDG